MIFFTIKTCLTQPVRTALRYILYMFGGAFLCLVLLRCYYGWNALVLEETAITMAACVRSLGCLKQDESLKNDPRHSIPCAEDKSICEREPWSRALEKISLIIPSWSALVAGVEDKFFVACFFGAVGVFLWRSLGPKIKKKKQDRDRYRVVNFRSELESKKELASDGAF